MDHSLRNAELVLLLLEKQDKLFLFPSFKLSYANWQQAIV